MALISIDSWLNFFYRDLNNPWEPYKGPLLLHPFFKSLLAFLAFGGFLPGRLHNLRISFDYYCTICLVDEISYVSEFRIEKFTNITYWYCRFLSPLSVVPLVTLTGLGLFVLGFPRVHALPQYYLVAVLQIFQMN